MKATHSALLRGLISALLWTVLLTGVLYYDITLAKRHVEALARKEARASFQTNQALRLWVVSHGGVYVPIDANTPPNPALARVPERDIETPSGKKLTLMNSAYVLRQMMSEFGDLNGIKGKLTSFKLLNLKNEPDDWEIEALHQFEAGRREVMEFTQIDGEPYLRMMSAMLVEEGCLKCHGSQGYKVGDVRGGFSLSVPMRPYWREFDSGVRQKLWGFFVIWLMGLAGLVSWSFWAEKRLREKAEIDAKLASQHQAIERANSELTHFANISAHHLMEPARRLLSYSQRLRNHLDELIEDDEARLSLRYIEQGAERMRDLIRDIERYLAASIVRGPLQTNDASTAVYEAQRRLSKLLLDRKATIEVKSLPAVFLDMPRLTDLFESLLANAVIHGGVHANPHIRISGQALKSSVRIRVEDNGPGIEPEYRERVFAVFEQLKPNPLAGTGIGLALARRIVESRDGQIWIEASQEGGAAVIFDLPVGGNR